MSLQIALRANGLKTLYVSGEESPQQIKMRAERLGVGNDECYIYSETNMENILRQIDEQAPDLVVIDSIQTIYTDTIDSSPAASRRSANAPPCCRNTPSRPTRRSS